jgi:hypothetical protein
LNNRKKLTGIEAVDLAERYLQDADGYFEDAVAAVSRQMSRARGRQVIEALHLLERRELRAVAEKYGIRDV